MTTNLYDPFPLPEAYLEKFEHHFEEGQRIRVKADGRKGKIETINRHGGINIKLDSGHMVEAHKSEIEPEDFPHVEPARSKASDAMAQSLEGFVQKSAGLMHALKGGSVSASDQALIRRSLEQIRSGAYVNSPYGDLSIDGPHRSLEIMAEKYSGTATSGDTFTTLSGKAFTKAAHSGPDADPEFKVGDRVKCKVTKKVGTITRLDYGFANVTYPDGEGISACDYLETAA